MGQVASAGLGRWKLAELMPGKRWRAWGLWEEDILVEEAMCLQVVVGECMVCRVSIVRVGGSEN